MRFIKLYEKITEWEWYDDIITFKVFCHLLLTVNWKETRWHGIDLKRGQRVISYHMIAEELHLTDKQVRTAIAHLRSTGEIQTSKARKWQVVTVENYEKYQGCDSDKGKVGARKTAESMAGFKAGKGQDETVEIPTDNEDTESVEGKVEGKQEGKQKGNRYRTIEQVEDIKNIPTVYEKERITKKMVDDVVQLYLQICPSLPRVRGLSDTRIKNIKKTLRTHTPEDIRTVFEKAEASDFLAGRKKDSDFIASLDWLMKSDNNFLKVLEGNYDNKNSAETKAVSDMRKITEGMTQEEYEEMERKFR